MTKGTEPDATNEVTLESIILPGTPESVRERYLSLAARAGESDFDLLEEDIVVLDTETTGLSFKRCELIEIAAARLSGREVIERFQTFVRPSKPIPPEIQRLTNISDSDVADAPSAREAVASLAEFVGGAPVLAHNATFDRTFIESVPGGTGVSDTWIDTLALSRIALPRLSTHRLSDLAHAFGCDSVTHRATDDVDALAGMWRIILLALTDLPTGLLGVLGDMHPEVEWSYRPIISHLALGEGDDQPFSLKEIRHDLVEEGRGHVREDVAESDVEPKAPSSRLIDQCFDEDGVASRMYGRLERRPDQLRMAQEVRDALAEGSFRAIEAGTGVGKSLAYLIPEVLFAQQNDLTVGVATKTNALTDQLVSHELPALSAALTEGVSFTSLKGYDHYPCLHRVETSFSADLPVSLVDGVGKSAHTIEAEMLTALAVTLSYCCQSPDGDLDALGIRWRFVPRSMLTVTPDECLRNKCPYFPNECLIHGARRRAAQSDVVVTNHSLLLRDVDMDGALLPPIRHWVVDEAHGFEAEARRQWAREVSGDAVRRGFEQLGGLRTGVIHQVMAQLEPVEGASLPTRLVTKLAAATSRAMTSMESLFDALHDLAAIAPQNGGYDSISLWIDEEVRQTPEWASLLECMEAAKSRLDEAAKDAEEASKAIAETNPQLAADLTSATKFVPETRDAIDLIANGTDETYVYSAELARRKRDAPSERLLAQKLDVGAEVGKRWLSQMRSVVFTSATMAVGKDFSHFEHAVGLDTMPAGRRKCVKLGSSFDYDHNMSTIVCSDMPQPGDREYLPALEDLLFDIHRAMGGSVLTLFTNRRDMERVYQGLAPRLRQVGLNLLCQERGTSPRRLREGFLAERSCSLLALRSFWEGFDATGDTLRCVVIPKLPFSSPTDPLVRERELREDRSWWRHSLPEAVISVKQAAGRLIRTSTDTGILVLADSRIVTKRYGRQFTSSLPTSDFSRLGRADIGRYIEDWRLSHE